MKESSQTMLAIETAMATCAVALCHCQGTQVVPLAQRISTPVQSCTVVLFPFNEEVLRERNGLSRLRSGRPGAKGLISRGVQTPLELDRYYTAPREHP